MNTKVTRDRADKILRAFLGMAIEVCETGKGKGRQCRVCRTSPNQDWGLGTSLIIERPTWEQVLLDLLPAECIPNIRKPPFNELNYASVVYQFRHIGKAIKGNS